jgi:hypothetical protein
MFTWVCLFAPLSKIILFPIASFNVYSIENWVHFSLTWFLCNFLLVLKMTPLSFFFCLSFFEGSFFVDSLNLYFFPDPFLKYLKWFLKQFIRLEFFFYFTPLYFIFLFNLVLIAIYFNWEKNFEIIFIYSCFSSIFHWF